MTTNCDSRNLKLRPPKIAMLEPLGDGGIAHYTYNLITSMVQKEVSIALFTAKRYELQGRIRNHYVYARLFPLSFALINKFPWFGMELPWPSRIRRILKGFEYLLNSIIMISRIKMLGLSCVHIQSVNHADVIPAIIARLNRLRLIITVHNVMPRHRTLKKQHLVLFKILYGLSHRIIIHTTEGKKRLVSLFKVEPSKIVVIPHGNYNFFVPSTSLNKHEARKKLELPLEAKIILFFGAIRPNKGLDTLLISLSEVRKEIPNVHLLIVGEPCEPYKKYTRLINKLKLRSQVSERLSYIPNEEVPYYFWATDLVALPYKEVTQSGVLQLAYAFSRPVLATQVGGLPEAIEDQRSGLLVPPNNIEALAKGLSTLLKDEKLLIKMGKYGKGLSQHRFSWDSISEKTLHVYKELVVNCIN